MRERCRLVLAIGWGADSQHPRQRIATDCCALISAQNGLWEDLKSGFRNAPVGELIDMADDEDLASLVVSADTSPLTWRASRRARSHELPWGTENCGPWYTVSQLSVADRHYSLAAMATAIDLSLCTPLRSAGAAGLVLFLPPTSDVVLPFLMAGFAVMGEVPQRSSPGKPLRIRPYWRPTEVFKIEFPHALILGRPSPNMIAQVRALGRCGILAHCLITRGESPEILRKSRYCQSVHDLRDGNDKEVIAAIQDIARYSSAGKPVVFCAGDTEISLLARIWDQVCNDVIAASEPLRAARLGDKAEQGRLAHAAGILVPKTVIVSSLSELNCIRDQLQFPVICRPIELAEKGAFREKIFVSATADALIGKLIPVFQKPEKTVLVVQEYIPGGDDCLRFALAVCDENGTALAMTTGRKVLQFPAGLMCRGETLVDARLERQTSAVLEKMAVGGVVGVEFKMHAETGDLFYIETNFRPENIISISEAAGCNLVFMGYMGSIGLRRLTVGMQSSPTAWRDTSLELFGWLSRRLPRPLVIARLKSQMREVDAVWASDDKAPAIAWYVEKIRRAMARIFSCSTSEVT